jgi:hypothetical protein
MEVSNTFCYASYRVGKVVNFTEPGDVMGMHITQVRWTRILAVADLGEGREGDERAARDRADACGDHGAGEDHDARRCFRRLRPSEPLAEAKTA